MTTTAQRPTNRRFFDTQPDPVRAIIELAETEGNDRIVALLAPEHADTLTDIADKLNWISRLGWDSPCAALTDYYGQPVHGIYLDQAADRLADELRVDVVTSAQLVASLLVGAR